MLLKIYINLNVAYSYVTNKFMKAINSVAPIKNVRMKLILNLGLT